MSYAEIGNFQLNNLLSQGIPFVFLALDEGERHSAAEFCAPSGLRDRVSGLGNDAPIVLSSRGEEPLAEAIDLLTEMDFINVYILRPD